MWKFVGNNRSMLLDYEFKHCIAITPRYIEDTEFGCGGDAFINDNEDYFRISDFCSPDDSIYNPEHIARKDEGWILETLINDGLVVWEEANYDA